jgi:hypothetical protein
MWCFFLLFLRVEVDTKYMHFVDVVKCDLLVILVVLPLGSLWLILSEVFLYWELLGISVVLGVGVPERDIAAGLVYFLITVLILERWDRLLVLRNGGILCNFDFTEESHEVSHIGVLGW